MERTVERVELVNRASVQFGAKSVTGREKCAWHCVAVAKIPYTPYAFTVRDLYWDGDYSISPDGTVTIPYKFGSSGVSPQAVTSMPTPISGAT